MCEEGIYEVQKCWFFWSKFKLRGAENLGYGCTNCFKSQKVPKNIKELLFGWLSSNIQVLIFKNLNMVSGGGQRWGWNIRCVFKSVQNCYCAVPLGKSTQWLAEKSGICHLGKDIPVPSCLSPTVDRLNRHLGWGLACEAEHSVSTAISYGQCNMASQPRCPSHAICPPMDSQEGTFWAEACIWGWIQCFNCNLQWPILYMASQPRCPVPSCPSPACRTKMFISQLLIKTEHWCLVHMKGLWKHFQNCTIWLPW